MSEQFRCFKCSHINVIGKETKPTLYQLQQNEITELKSQLEKLEEENKMLLESEALIIQKAMENASHKMMADVQVPEASPTRQDYYKAASRHCGEWLFEYAQTITEDEGL